MCSRLEIFLLLRLWRHRTRPAPRAQGDSVLAEVEQRPDTLVYGFPLQGSRIRFTIAYSSTTWHEVGQLIMPNGNAIPTVEMRLKKQ